MCLVDIHDGQLCFSSSLFSSSSWYRESVLEQATNLVLELLRATQSNIVPVLAMRQ